MDDRRLGPLRPSHWFLPALACLGCATLGDQGQPLVPTKYETRTGPYSVFSNFPIEPDAPAIRCLQLLEGDIQANLGIHVLDEKPAVNVYILNDRQKFNHFLKFYYPELPPRRAFFLAQGPERVVYTFLGDRLEEDLRHEATHALLHVAVGDLPLWLDEGLAEYFEGPEEQHGRNAENLDRLPQDRAAGWAPDLPRLESLKVVSQMAPRDYREAWAWVHYLLHHSGATKAALLGYLADLRSNPTAAPLSERLKGTDTSSPTVLLAHIDQVEAQRVTAAPPTPRVDSTVRLQDNQVELARAGGDRVLPVPRRSVFDRFRSFFGLD